MIEGSYLWPSVRSRQTGPATTDAAVDPACPANWGCGWVLVEGWRWSANVAAAAAAT